MTGVIHLRLEPPSAATAGLRFAARVEAPFDAPSSLFFDVDAPAMDGLAPDGAPFLLAMLFPAMEHACDVALDAPVSALLLEQLHRIQDAWTAWRPGHYQHVDLRAPCHPRAIEPADRGTRTTAFSGGLDSCYTLHRWRRRGAPGPGPRLQAGVFVHGFDIPLGRSEESRRAYEAARRIAASVALPLASVRTNLRGFPSVWEDAHGAALAAVLHLFQGVLGGGLIPATVSVHGLGDRWGSHPALDPWFSSEHFPVASDGHEASRSMKVGVLADWPEARANLRVCYTTDDLAANCGRCRKCVFTKCMMLARGIPLEGLLAGAPTFEDTASLRLAAPWKRRLVAETVAGARERGLADAPWARGLRRALWLHRFVPGWGRRAERPAAPFPDFSETAPPLREEPSP